MATATTAFHHSPTEHDLETLAEIERRVLWLAVRIVDHANRERPSRDPLKVGGHQASSASIATIMTALWFWDMGAGDRVSVKPHASPVLHAIQYLLGGLERRHLTTLREFGGLQAYPSRTKDPFPVDYSTGSVGLGAAAPLFGALTARYVESHFGRSRSGRFISLLGDAELDEGNVWEAINDPATAGLGDAVWIVDLNRQSLDRVVPLIRAGGLGQAFRSAGWDVIELKYGRRLREAFAQRGGKLLRRRIDELSNPEYQSLFAADEDAVIEALVRPLGPKKRRKLLDLLEGYEGEVGSLIQDLGGHDLADLTAALASTHPPRDRPTVIFAYTIKGYRLPIAGHPLNHSAHLTAEQIEQVRTALADGDDWAPLRGGTAAAALASAARERLGSQPPPEPRRPIEIAPSAGRPIRGEATQEAFGRALLELASEPGVAERIVTTAPDVSVSTNLGGWINRFGVYAPEDEPDFTAGEALRWRVGPEGRHIELGISEMNLFLLLGQLGLSHELTGELLLPIGTVYDPFVCRGLDALIYGLYSDSRFVIAGTPSGISLSREGGAHQSTITPSIGIELPGIAYAEPAYAAEVDWLLRDGLRRLSEPDGESLYLRLSTKPIDQAPFEAARKAMGDDALRDAVLAGGYWLQVASGSGPGVTIAASGAMIPEAVEAAALLESDDGIAASVLAVTSPDRLYRGWRSRQMAPLANANDPRPASHLELLFEDQPEPIVSVIDGASHSLAFLGSALGRKQVTLGVDRFGQSGSLPDVYDAYDLSPDAIASAAIAALSP
jgi:pyruvate dehydrogenase E1 component